MFIRTLKLTSFIKVAVATGLVLALCSFAFGKAEASGAAWYGVATGTCEAPVSVDQVMGGQAVLVVGSGLMPGSSFVYTVSSYGATSRGSVWSMRQIGQVGQNGMFCALVLVADPADQGTFLMEINGVDATMRQYNPGSQIFMVTPAPVPQTDEGEVVVVGDDAPTPVITPITQ